MHLFAGKILLWVGDAGLEEWPCPEKKPCPILSFLPLCLSLLFFFFFILNWTVLICDMIWNTMKTKCVDRLAFTELWCQEAFGKTPSPNTYKVSDQILYGRLLAFWSLQNRDELLWGCSWAGLSVVLSFWGCGYAEVERADCVGVGWGSLSVSLHCC